MPSHLVPGSICSTYAAATAPLHNGRNRMPGKSSRTGASWTDADS